MQHIEFLDNDHFENNYHRVPPPAALSHFIDFFWETKFDPLWIQHPKGFSDAQFPNIGYTYIINLGTPFVMQVDDKKIAMKTDGFLPRYNAIECFHKPGNHLFGIKFRVSPVILEKKINFSEYKGYIFPLSYLLNPQIIEQVKKARSFEERISILTYYFTRLLNKYEGSLQAVHLVSKILDHVFQQNKFSLSLEKEAARHKISARTLQRYFEACTGIGGKQALQIMRIRKAVTHIVNSPGDFNYSLYGYYDHSHFYKHLKQFLQKNTLKNIQPHLTILESLHKKM
jgi:AraC-like DNA-binding protein